MSFFAHTSRDFTSVRFQKRGYLFQLIFWCLIRYDENCVSPHFHISYSIIFNFFNFSMHVSSFENLKIMKLSHFSNFSVSHRFKAYLSIKSSDVKSDDVPENPICVCSDVHRVNVDTIVWTKSKFGESRLGKERDSEHVSVRRKVSMPKSRILRICSEASERCQTMLVERCWERTRFVVSL